MRVDERGACGSSGTVIRQANGANLAALMASDTWLDADTYTGNPVSVKNLTLEGNPANNPGRVTDGIVLMSWNSTPRLATTTSPSAR